MKRLSRQNYLQFRNVEADFGHIHLKVDLNMSPVKLYTT